MINPNLIKDYINLPKKCKCELIEYDGEFALSWVEVTPGLTVKTNLEIDRVKPLGIKQGDEFYYDLANNTLAEKIEMTEEERKGWEENKKAIEEIKFNRMRERA